MIFSPNTFAGAPHTFLATLAVGSFDDRRLLGAVGALPGDLLLLPCLVGHAR